MPSVIFRRVTGQHFIVFLESMPHTLTFLEKLDMPNEILNFQFWAPLESFLDLTMGEERMVGSSPNLQVIIRRGHGTLKPMPKISGPDMWPEHYVAVSEGHLGAYLRKNHTYKWAPGKCNGIYDNLGAPPYIHDIRNVPETYGFSPELVSEGSPFVFVLNPQDDFNVWWN